MKTHSNFAAAVIAVVREIPEGQVATYGDVATWVGRARAARAVGSVLRGLDERDRVTPWHRVINSSGRVSMGGTPGRALHQRNLLQSEGHRFDANGQLNLEERRWEPGAEAVRDWIERFDIAK